MAALIVMKGLTPGTRYELPENNPAGLIMGRQQDCTIVLDNNSVSRQHARIFRINDVWYVEDLKSRNKTYLNHEELQGRAPLKDGDRIKICDYLFRFEETPQRKPLPAAMAPEIEPINEQFSVQASIASGSVRAVLDSQPSDKLRALLDISTQLSKTLDIKSLLPQIAETLFQVFRQADRCFIITREEPDQLVPQVIKTRTKDSDSSARFSRTIVRRCLDTLESYLSEDASADQNLGAAASIAEFRIRSVLCAPIVTPDNKALGVIQLDTQQRNKRFTQDDLKLLCAVAGQAAVAMENARLHENLIARSKLDRDLEIARQVQFSFLPQQTPVVPNYEIFHFYSPAQMVGGDYYDFLPMPDGRLALFVGDVAGKGVPAALLMAKLSAEARYCTITDTDPASIVCKLNDALISAGMLDRFIALAAAFLDPKTNRVALVNAGQMTPMIYRASDEFVGDAMSSSMSGTPLGVIEGFPYEAVEVQLQPGDTIFMFSDGVSDAMSPTGDMFGIQGIHRVLRSDNALHTGGLRPNEVGQRIIQGVRQHARGRDQNDDIALVAFGLLDESMLAQANDSSINLGEVDVPQRGAVTTKIQKYD
jgi:sigma-B regulation protein RsbU (phosphoserine phosphatase)